MLQPALLGGLFIGVLSALPVLNLGNCCCLWFTGGGFLAAYLALQSEPTRTLTLGRGALAGLAAAVAGAFIWLIIHSVLQVTLGPAMQEVAYDQLQNPDFPPAFREVFEDFARDGTSPLATALSFIFQLVVGSIFASLGGLAGAAFFRRDNVPPALGGPPPPPPPPQSPDGWTP